MRNRERERERNCLNWQNKRPVTTSPMKSQNLGMANLARVFPKNKHHKQQPDG